MALRVVPGTPAYSAAFTTDSLVTYSLSFFIEAGVRGIKACLKEKAAYEKCMDEYIKKNPIKLIRVQEEYRRKPDP